MTIGVFAYVLVTGILWGVVGKQIYDRKPRLWLSITLCWGLMSWALFLLLS